MDIENKVAVITGGASGLGLATAEEMVIRGAKIVIFDLNEEQGQAICEKFGDNAIFANVDVSDENSVKAGIAKAVDTFGTIHICINCAGIGSAQKTYGRQGPHDLGVFNKTIQINLVGTFNVLRLVAEIMANNEPVTDDGERGAIVNTASVAAFDGQVGQVAYSASKGGVVGMTLPIARDLAPVGIRVNVIAPGIFNTPLMNSAPDKVKLPLIEMTQFPKRLGHPREYAQMVCQLVENSFVNGEVIRVDGSIRMHAR